MPEPGVNSTITGGEIHGFVGCYIANINFAAGADRYLPSEPPKTIDPKHTSVCPYPGLQNFWQHDAHLFFGRECAIRELEASVTRHAFTALAGASGSGKSSVVLAGLAPRLFSRGTWLFTHFRISREQSHDPFLALTRALVSILDGDEPTEIRLEQTETLSRQLESGSLSLANLLSECRARNPGKRIMLIADQFEELFTLVPKETRRRRFIETLLSGFPNHQEEHVPQISLILTLRADFFDAVLLNRQLSDALQNRVTYLSAMLREELVEAILRPAGAVVYESGLVETVLDEVEESPGSLPLLQFALKEMWKRQENGCITRKIYDAVGGVCGALAQHAQQKFEELTSNCANEDQVRLFRQLFTRLVTFGEGTRDTRRVVERSELNLDAWELAQELSSEDNRLIVTNSSELGHQTVEFVHEALIVHWPTLGKWIKEDRRFQSWLRQLKPSLDAWKSDRTDSTRLLSGFALVTAEEWLTQRDADLSDNELAYVRSSIAFRDAEKRRVGRIKAFLLASAIMVAFVIGFLWLRARSAAERANHDYSLAVNAARSTTLVVRNRLHANAEVKSPGDLAVDLLDGPKNTFAKIEGPESTDSALARLELFESLWNTYYNIGFLPQADEAARTEFEIAEHEQNRDRPLFASLRWKIDKPRPDWLHFMTRAEENLGDDARDQNDLSGGETHFKNAVRLAAQLAADHPETAWINELAHAHERLGDSYRGQHRFPEALAEFQKFFSNAAKPEEPSLQTAWLRNRAIVHGKIGDILLIQGDLAGAEREYDTNLAMSSGLANKEPKNLDLQRGIGIAHERLGFLRRMQGRAADAAHEYQQELEITDQLLQSNSRNTNWLRDNALANEGLGDLLFDKTDWKDALKYYATYLQDMNSWFKYSPTDTWVRRDVAIGYQRMGLAHLKLGQKAVARSAFQQCLSLAKGASEAYDPRNPDPSSLGQACSASIP